MAGVQRVRAPSGAEVDLVESVPLLMLVFKYPLPTMGRAWLPAVERLDNVLRVLDRPALRSLKHDGAQDASTLAESLAGQGRFRSKRLATDVDATLMGAWLDFADRRSWIEPYATGDVQDAQPRWSASGRGLDELKGSTGALRSLPMWVGLITGLVGLAANLAGGAVVLNQFLEKNLEVVSLIAILVAVVILNVLAGRAFASRVARCQVAAIQIVRSSGRLDLPPEPRRGSTDIRTPPHPAAG